MARLVIIATLGLWSSFAFSNDYGEVASLIFPLPGFLRML